MPSKADPIKQCAFLYNTLNPLIDLAVKEKIQLFFVDASHFVQGGFIGQLWSRTRIFIKTASGRSRYNVLGTINFVSKKMTTITNDTYITSAQVIMLIDKLLLEYQDQAIKLVLDNARYQRCKLVMEYALKHKVELVFLTTYSPNLNLIEHVWKFVKNEVLNAAYIGSFEDFKNTIDTCLDQLDKKHKGKMKTLITCNFQLFDTPDEGSFCQQKAA